MIMMMTCPPNPPTGPYIQNIYVDTFAKKHGTKNTNTNYNNNNNNKICGCNGSSTPAAAPISSSSPNENAVNNVNYFIPTSSSSPHSHSLEGSNHLKGLKDHPFQQASAGNEINYTEEQICRRTLFRILLLGLFLLIFVFIVYKVIKREVTERIFSEMKRPRNDEQQIIS